MILQSLGDYLTSLGMTGLLAKRAVDIQILYTEHLNTEHLGVEIGDIFVSEYTTEEGNGEYESLWLFNHKRDGPHRLDRIGAILSESSIAPK